jgi:cytochrome c-type biogenesis protein CcmF
MVIGLVATSAWREERIVALAPGSSVDIAGYQLTFKGVEPRIGPNYRERVGTFDISRGGKQFTVLHPSKREFTVERNTTTESGIHNGWRGDLYVVLGDELKDGAFTVRVYFNPLVRLIWIGALVMFFAGAVSLSDRRLRVGAPKRARSKAATATAGK